MPSSGPVSVRATRRYAAGSMRRLPYGAGYTTRSAPARRGSVPSRRCGATPLVGDTESASANAKCPRMGTSSPGSSASMPSADTPTATKSTIRPVAPASTARRAFAIIRSGRSVTFTKYVVRWPVTSNTSVAARSWARTRSTMELQGWATRSSSSLTASTPPRARSRKIRPLASGVSPRAGFIIVTSNGRSGTPRRVRMPVAPSRGPRNSRMNDPGRARSSRRSGPSAATSPMVVASSSGNWPSRL